MIERVVLDAVSMLPSSLRSSNVTDVFVEPFIKLRRPRDAFVKAASISLDWQLCKKTIGEKYGVIEWKTVDGKASVLSAEVGATSS